MENINIFVCTNKKNIIKKNKFYKLLFCGAALEKKNNLKGILQDNINENISAKNKNFCELTGIYWIWKNIVTDYKGICHYRRYFNKKNISRIEQQDIEKGIKLKERDIVDNLIKYDMIVGKKVKVEPSVEISYGVSHRKEDISVLKKVIEEICEEKYKIALEKVMKKNYFYPCNMFIASNQVFNEYCEWLFKVLFELEKRITIPEDQYQARIFGFISERMLGVYIEANNLKVKELKITRIDEKLELSLYKRMIYKIRTMI